jgi:hypothetical protein
MMKIRDYITRMKYTAGFMDGMGKQTLNRNFYVKIVNDSPITSAINLALVHLHNKCVNFLALKL